MEEMKHKGRWDSDASLVMPPSHAVQSMEKESDTDIKSSMELNPQLKVAIMLAEKTGEVIFVDDITGQALDTDYR